MKPIHPDPNRGPLYRQIKVWVLQAVADGEFAPGDRFPSEVELAKMAGVTRATVRQATNELVAEGVLIREMGKRPRVAPKKMVADFLELGGMTHYTARDDFTYFCRVLQARYISPDETVRHALGLNRRAKVFCLERLRSTQGAIFSYEKTWINRKFCPSIDRHDFSRESLYTVFHKDYGLVPSHSQGLIDVAVAGAAHARLLMVRETTPLLCVHRTIFTAKNQPLQVNLEIYRGDKYSFAYKAGHRK